VKVKIHKPESEAARAAAIDAAFAASARRRAEARFEANARAAVKEYRVEKARVNPKAAFLALFKSEVSASA